MAGGARHLLCRARDPTKAAVELRPLDLVSTRQERPKVSCRDQVPDYLSFSVPHESGILPEIVKSTLGIPVRRVVDNKIRDQIPTAPTATQGSVDEQTISQERLKKEGRRRLAAVGRLLEDRQRWAPETVTQRLARDSAKKPGFCKE